MRWTICIISLLLAPQVLAADWWWKDYTPQYNQGTQLQDPAHSNTPVDVTQNPAPGSGATSLNPGNSPSGNLSTQPPVILLGKDTPGMARQVSAGTFHSLLLKKDGTVYGTGDNTYGQLGTGDSSTMLGSWSKVAQGMQEVAACSYFSLAIATDGTVWATGDNIPGGSRGMAPAMRVPMSGTRH